MGKLLGRRLLADDEKFYPPKTAAERRFDKERRACHREYSRISDATLNVTHTIHRLADLKASDEEILAYLADEPIFGDAATIARDIAAAIERLQSFADA